MIPTTIVTIIDPPPVYGAVEMMFDNQVEVHEAVTAGNEMLWVMPDGTEPQLGDFAVQVRDPAQYSEPTWEMRPAAQVMRT